MLGRKRMRIKLALCLVCLATPMLAEANPLRIGKYTLPTRLVDSLNQGLNVAVYLKYVDRLESENQERQKIADATITMKDGQLYIQHIEFNDVQTETELSESTKARLNKISDRPFDENMQLSIHDDANLSLDLQSLYLELSVEKSALGTRLIPRSDVLKESSVSSLSSIMNYRFGSYYNSYNNEDNSSSYLSLASMTALGEHHLALNGSIYGIGTSDQDAELYRALYERDFEGRRFAVGLMDTWSMQSIANFSAINSSKIYGASYGNQSQTIIHDRSLSLTPIVLFLPNAATVQVYRDGRLISIQNLPMGSQELDTSTFPYGIYSVEIKTLINGQPFSETTAQVNKSRGRLSTDTKNIEWQVFGGMVEYRPSRRVFGTPDDDVQGSYHLDDKETWLMGGAVAKNFDWFSGSTLRSTLYGFDNTVVTELDGTVNFTPSTNFSLQTMLASDSSVRAISTLNYALPKQLGNVWMSYDMTELGDKVNVDEQDNISLGTSFNLSGLYDKLGTINASYSHDRENNNRHTNLEYSQNVFDSRYANVRFRAGMHNYDYNTQDHQDDRYLFIDVSMPIARWFSAGISSRNSNILADVSFKQNFKEGLISNLGLDLSKSIHTDDDNINPDDKRLSVNGYLGYEGKYNEGILSAGVTGDNRSFNYSSQGSIAWVDRHLALSHLSQDSGVLIHTDLADKGNMSALINGQTYPLSGKRNFIPLQPYQSYNIELTNAKNSMDSVNILHGRKNSAVLYPGNIAVIAPSIQQTVTVFARLYDANGQVLAKQEVRSQMSKASTDEHGEFSIDVDKRYANITVEFEDGSQCETAVNIKEARGAVWLGDLSCQGQAFSANRRHKGSK